MKTSCGVIVSCGGHILLGHVTRSSRFDLPKGCLGKDELPVNAAVRELYEETSIRSSADDLIDLGEFDYLRYKKLHLFRLDLSARPEPLHCSSFVSNDPLFPEMDYFIWCDVNSLALYMSDTLFKVVADALGVSHDYNKWC